MKRGRAMKLDDNYILKTVAGTSVVVPVGEAVENIHGMIRLNDSAELVWKGLEEGKEREALLEDMKKEYPDVSEDILSRDLDAFLNVLKEKNILL